MRWESDGGGEYSLEAVERENRGTEVILHLKEAEQEFLSKWSIRSLISRYSDHIGFPIRMHSEDEEARKRAVAGRTSTRPLPCGHCPRVKSATRSTSLSTST